MPRHARAGRSEWAHSEGLRRALHQSSPHFHLAKAGVEDLSWLSLLGECPRLEMDTWTPWRAQCGARLL